MTLIWFVGEAPKGSSSSVPLFSKGLSPKKLL